MHRCGGRTFTTPEVVREILELEIVVLEMVVRYWIKVIVEMQDRQRASYQEAQRAMKLPDPGPASGRT